jgi:hypothetical protein
MKRRYESEEGPVRLDAEVEFEVITAGRRIFGPYRLVRVWVEEKQEYMEFLTNLMDLSAKTVARIYKDRWQVELFFKALKQNLRVKSFVGTSENAVRIQLWTALITILLMRYLQFRSKCGWCLSHMVALLRWNLFSYRDIWLWLSRPFDTPPQAPPDMQMQFILESIP